MIAPMTSRVVNVSSVPHRSPFRYPGGKTWLVPYIRKWIESLDRRPFEFAEPFAGGATVGLSVLFDELAVKVTLVEMDRNVASVWKTVLSVQGERLASEILSFQMSEGSVKSCLSNNPRHQFERAFQTILKNRVQRGGIMAPGASLMKQGENGKGLASRWYPETLARRILAITENKHRIRFFEGDGIQFIHQNAGRSDVAFFIDPPYTLAARRLYVHSQIDHEKLFLETSSIRGDFLMTYDDCKPIRALAARFGFDTHKIPMKNTHHEIMHELLVGRDLGWARKPLQLGQNPRFESLQADRHAGREALY
ncbi:MAG TPA: DNA adenine methylase [Candidatus Acidoferrales bacterium]|nr:DNA adenine methylase [Candidatus Acidoferrales bacterium]